MAIEELSGNIEIRSYGLYGMLTSKWQLVQAVGLERWQLKIKGDYTGVLGTGITNVKMKFTQAGVWKYFRIVYVYTYGEISSGYTTIEVYGAGVNSVSSDPILNDSLSYGETPPGYPDSLLNDGWKPVSSSATYVSSSSFKVSGDMTAYYKASQKVKLTQTTLKYFLATAVSYATGYTTITVDGGGTYTLADASIESVSISDLLTPNNYPSTLPGNITQFVVGPSSATDNNIVTFNSTTGKLVKDGGITLAQLLTQIGYVDGWVAAGETWTWASGIAGTAFSTAFTNDLSPGSNVVINMTDTSGFNVGDFVVVGSDAGKESATITVVTTNTSITVDVLALDHGVTSRYVYRPINYQYTFTVSGDVTTKYSPGMRIKLTQTSVKYFIITALSFSSPNTTITVFGGTDYELTNTTISSPYYSMVKIPAGFPASPEKWTVVLHKSSEAWLDPAPDTDYNIADLFIAIPIGVWDLRYNIPVLVGRDTADDVELEVYMSTNTSGCSDNDLRCIARSWADDSTGIWLEDIFSRSKYLTLTTKAAYFVMLNAVLGGEDLYLCHDDSTGGDSHMVIEARCGYL